jgi:hypothetical protein
MVCFQTKNPNLGKFWKYLQWKILVYFMTIWSIFRPCCIFYRIVAYFVVIWYISPVLVNCTTQSLATLVMAMSCTTFKANREALRPTHGRRTAAAQENAAPFPDSNPAN